MCGQDQQKLVIMRNGSILNVSAMISIHGVILINEARF